MGWFKDLRMAQKLISSFMVMAILIGVVGVIGIISMRKINSNVTSIYQIDLKGVSDINTIKTNIMQVQADYLQMIDPNKRNDLQSLDGDINLLVDQDNKLIKDYKGTITTNQRKENFTQFENFLNDYRTERGKLIDAIKSRDYSEAEKDFPNLSKISWNMMTVLDREIDLCSTMADNDYQNSGLVYNASFTMVICDYFRNNHCNCFGNFNI